MKDWKAEYEKMRGTYHYLLKMLRHKADRIAELEKEVDKASEQSWYRFNKNGYAKPLTNDEIREIGDECELKNNGRINWIQFARAIEERHGIK